MIEVTAIKPDELHWPFDGQGQPYLLVPDSDRYPSRVVVDPFPAYAHDRQMVEMLAEQVGHLWPVPWRVQIVILPYETPSRSNGWADTNPTGYDSDGKAKGWRTNIAFAAKRIPIHPAVTRYLVFHEYGHAVEEAIQFKRGLKVTSDDLMAEYRKVRGLSPDGVYGGGVWHQQACEVFANDFRILICGVEPEFWPHRDTPRPEQVDGLREWWDAARETCCPRELAPVGAEV